MHCLENVLLVTSVAVANDEISKAELVRVLEGLAGASHSYVPEVEEPKALPRMNDKWNRRFGHLMVALGSEAGMFRPRPAPS
jgi:hypothetical protein